MANLTSLTLPIGSATDRLTLTQQQVDTLIKVYYDQNITSKNVSGYVFKESITTREYYLLTQLGLDVAYTTMQPDVWTFAVDRNSLADGDTATFIIGGGLTLQDIVMEIGAINITDGAVTETQLRGWLTLENGTLTFDRDGSTADVSASVTVTAHPIWNSEDIKTISLVVDSYFRTVWINPANQSTALKAIGNRGPLEDYINHCKCYVFSSDGTTKAEIASAIFRGNYSGMTEGTVTFADGTTVNITDLNNAGCNFMVLRPELHIFSGLNEDSEEILRCTGAFSAGTGEKVFPKKYIGMFKGFLQNGVLKSQPNRIPTGQQTIAQFQTYAVAGGTGYGQWNYSDWCKENAIHLSWFANTNYDVNVGIGRIGSNSDNGASYNRIRNIVTGFTLPIAGQYKCGKVATQDQGGNSVYCLNFFGVEGLGEQIWEFVIGFRHNGTHAFIWDANEWSENHAPDRDAVALRVTSASGAYIKSIIAGADFDMLPREVGATSGTGMCDGHWVQNTGRLLRVGGDAAHGSLCGLSASDASYAFSSSSPSVGARLAFYGEPNTRTGAEFVASLT